MNKKKVALKFSMWFILLSTVGVGGGIFYLLFAIVPIEEWYVQRGWSQFTIDGVMKYYVVGWVVFGFIMSFIYYFFCLKKERWVVSSILCVASIGLCVAGLNYFLNTGSSVIQASQGEVEVGERFTFGPYPEKVTLQELKDQGYDGVIALLSPTLPIETPLLNKEINNGKEVGIEILSMPMLPWVGDNTETLNEIRALIEQSDKRYYVHCYLGRHRVDVVKQLVNEASGEEHELLVLQPTSFERGHVYYDAKNEVIFGPFPTDEEWFTRIRRGEVQEILSIYDPSDGAERVHAEEKVATEMNMKFTHMPLPASYTKEDLQKIVDYVKQTPQKIFVHDFFVDEAMQELQSLYLYGTTMSPVKDVKKIVPSAQLVGARYVVGQMLTAGQKQTLQKLGVEQFVTAQAQDAAGRYQEVKAVVDSGQITYVMTAQAEQQSAFYYALYGMVYGYEHYRDLRGMVLDGNGTIDVRNLTYGPILTEQQIVDFILPRGMKQVVYIHSPALSSMEELEKLQVLFEKYGVPLKVQVFEKDYEKKVISLLNAEQGSNYVMVHEDILSTVMELLDQY